MLLALKTLVITIARTRIKLITFTKTRTHGVQKKKPITKEVKKPTKRIKIIYPIPLVFKLRYFFIGALFSLLFFFLPLVTIIFLQELPNPRELTTTPIPQTTKIYDRNGALLYEIYIDQNRSVISLSSIPKDLVNATIAVEDKDFYRHPGFNFLSIVRAAKRTFIDKDLQGGSTITQQLIRTSFLTQEPTIGRKIKELVLAFWAERMYTKDQLLEMYLNRVPYGGTAYGIEAASQTYFGKSVRDLTLGEAALLAGLPAAPTIYSPFGSHPEYAKRRQIEVINRMVALGFVNDKAVSKAIEEELVFKNHSSPFKAPHFVLFVKDFLAQKYGLRLVEQGGLRVTTSLDLATQEMAQNLVHDEVEKIASLNVTNGAALVTNPSNGDILVMVGSKDYFGKEGNFNVVLSPRQPGSTIKAVTYAAAFEDGFTAATILEDTPATFSGLSEETYSPVNYDGRFHGRVSLRSAFANSYNVPAVKTLSKIGVDKMVVMGKRLGIRSWDGKNNFGLSLTLGGGEITMIDLATVYGVLANGGERVELNPILKITSAKGEVIEEKGTDKKQVLDKGIAFILSDILADNNARSAAFGTNSVLSIPNRFIPVKTGTSDNKRDNWTIGFTKEGLVAVWVGNNNNSPMHPSLTSGVTGAAPIWNKIMSSLLVNGQNDNFSPPGNVLTIPCLGRKEYFIRGTESRVNCKLILPSPTPTPDGQINP